MRSSPASSSPVWPSAVSFSAVFSSAVVRAARHSATALARAGHLGADSPGSGGPADALAGAGRAVTVLSGPPRSFAALHAFARPLVAALLLLPLACDPGTAPPILDHRALLERFDWWDNRDWDWFEARIPFFESPEPELDATYYYRWELLTKHLVYGSPETGYTLTEFIDRPFWSGTYGAISCPLGHQAYEIRWLKDRRIIEDFARYWFETPGAQPRSYSNWYGDAMWATYEVLGDRELLRTVYPHMETQVEGWNAERWDPEHGMYRWVGAWDGMETNINSRLTDDEFGGAEGYRPTLNSYLFADLLALSTTAALFGEGEKAAAYRARAEALKARIQEELWDPEREFFFHQFAFDEKDGIRAKSLTYQTGPHAGSPHGRELLGYVPWQFGLPDPGYEVAWKYLMDTAYFAAPYGPTGVERGDPQFFVSPRCCVWSGNAWPYATTQTLAAMANLLNDYEQGFVDRDDYVHLLRTYALSHRRDGRPYVAEAADPFTGSWDGHNTFYHSEHYLHSGFVDLVITGLVGIRPGAGDTLVVRPLAPEEWDYFALEGVRYHGREVTVLWDRVGDRYGRGAGLAVYVDNFEAARVSAMTEVVAILPPLAAVTPDPRLHNYAVNNDGGHFPLATASSSRPTAPPFYAVDGNRWYHPSPPNRWVAGGGGASTAQHGPAAGGAPESESAHSGGSALPDATTPSGADWFEVDFGVERALTVVQLYFLDDDGGPPVEAVGDEAATGFPSPPDPGALPVLPPEGFDLELWDGERWRAIPEQRRVPAAPAGRRANTVTFPEARAAKLRVVLRHRAGATSGLTEMETWGHGDLPLPEPSAPVANLAWNPGDRLHPRVTASFTGPNDDPAQAVDGRLSFTRYSRNRWTAYGSTNPEDWLEVDFGEPREVGRVELFLYADGRGVAAPLAYRVEVSSIGGWEGVRALTQTPALPTAWAVNTLELEPVRTSRVRVLFTHPSPAFAGLTEIRVWPR